jgi:hypothetical protein
MGSKPKRPQVPAALQLLMSASGRMYRWRLPKPRPEWPRMLPGRKDAFLAPPAEGAVRYFRVCVDGRTAGAFALTWWMLELTAGGRLQIHHNDPGRKLVDRKAVGPGASSKRAAQRMNAYTSCTLRAQPPMRQRSGRLVRAERSVIAATYRIGKAGKRGSIPAQMGVWNRDSTLPTWILRAGQSTPREWAIPEFVP